MNHWHIRGNQITSYVRVAGENEAIATVQNERAVRQMLRYSQLGQDAESLIDQYAAGIATPEETAEKLYKLVIKTIEDTSSRGKIPCPEI